MKVKLVVISSWLVVAIMLMAGCAYAWDITPDNIFQQLKKVPENVRQGGAIGLSKEDSNTYSLASVDMIGWGKGQFGLTEDKLFLGGGIATDFIGDNLEVATLSYGIGGLEKLGFSYPFKNYIDSLEVGGWIGRDFINTGDDKAPTSYGLQITGKF
jgi:hypothetical protein